MLTKNRINRNEIDNIAKIKNKNIDFKLFIRDNIKDISSKNYVEEK